MPQIRFADLDYVICNSGGRSHLNFGRLGLEKLTLPSTTVNKKKINIETYFVVGP